MVGTPYDVSFRVDRDNESLCKKELNAKDLKKFRKAVKDDYYFQVSSAGFRTGNRHTQQGGATLLYFGFPETVSLEKAWEKRGRHHQTLARTFFSHATSQGLCVPTFHSDVL